MEHNGDRLESRNGHGTADRREWLLLVVVFLAACSLIVSRRPDALLNPQFFAEDGPRWYQMAYDLGPLRTLFIPFRGYFVLAQRAGGALGLAVPLEWAPLVFNLFGLAIQALGAVFLASTRILPARPLWLRLAMAGLYVAMPATWGLTANLTNCMWYLSVLACMIVVADPPRRPGWRVFDATMLVLAGLTGPYALFLAPVAAVKWWTTRHRRDLWVAGATGALAAVQATSLLLGPPPSGGQISIGFSLDGLARIVTQRIVYGALFGQVGSLEILANPANALGWQSTIVAAALTGVAALAYAAWRGPRELRLFILFASLGVAAALVWPATNDRTFWWDLLKHPGLGNRYFMAVVFVLLTTLVWFTAQRMKPLRIAGAIGLVVAVVFGIRLDWSEPPYADFNFGEAVVRYRVAQAGERVRFLSPPGWAVELTKRGPAEPIAEVLGGREVGVEPVLLGVHELAWEGTTALATGVDPHLTYAVPDAGAVRGIRLTYILTTQGNTPGMLQLFWMKEGRNAFVAEERNSCAFVTPDAAAQTTYFRMDGRVDRLRIDPHTTGSRFRLLEMTLFVDTEGGAAAARAAP